MSWQIVGTQDSQLNVFSSQQVEAGFIPRTNIKKLSQGKYQAQGLLWSKYKVYKAKKVGVDRRPWALEAQIHLYPEQQKRGTYEIVV